MYYIFYYLKCEEERRNNLAVIYVKIKLLSKNIVIQCVYSLDEFYSVFIDFLSSLSRYVSLLVCYKKYAAFHLPESYSLKFRTILYKLVSPWSIEARYDILPILTVTDSIELVPEYCWDIASPLSAHMFLYNFANGVSS